MTTEQVIMTLVLYLLAFSGVSLFLVLRVLRSIYGTLTALQEAVQAGNANAAITDFKPHEIEALLKARGDIDEEAPVRLYDNQHQRS